jgi:predicted nucleotidyltransferase
MNLASPLSDVVPGARAAILATLAQLAVPVTVRALSRHAGVSPQGTLQVVNDLAVAGLVDVRPAGRALMVSLNREHLAADAILQLASLRGRLIDRLKDELEGWRGLAGAWLFGSAARGDGHRGSDIDLLLVADATATAQWDAACAQLTTSVRAWTGNPVQLVEHTKSSFASLVRRKNPLIAALRADAIALTSRTARLLRGAA